MNGSEDNPKGHSDGEPGLEPQPPLPPVVLGPIEMNDSSPAEETPRPLPLPYRSRRPAAIDLNPSSRELLLGWCLWLLGSWIILGMGFQRTPIREMILASMLGMMLLWPAFRLSQDGRRRRTIHRDTTADVAAMHTDSHAPGLTPGLILRDWFALNCVFQAVVWPHVLTEQWHMDQAAWVTAAVAAWSLLAGAVTSLGCLARRNAGRVAAMAAIVLLLFGEPVVLAWMNRLGEDGQLGGFDWPMHVSPIEAIYALTAKAVDFDPSPWAVPVMCVALAAFATWAAAIATSKHDLRLHSLAK